MKPLSELTLVICGIVRDAERGLKHNIPVIDELTRMIKDYRIVMYENDSKDGTKEVLRRWHERDPLRIHVCLNDSDAGKTTPSAGEVACNPFYSRKRICKMARLRNHYMAYVEEAQWTGDLLMVVDMDVAQLHLDGILDTLRAPQSWDAVVANGSLPASSGGA